MTAEILNDSDIVVLDLKGVSELRASIAGPLCVIGIHADIDVRKERMLQHGDSEDAVKARLKHDKVAFGNMQDCCDIHNQQP